jgi:hypothetical protein
MKRVDCGGLCFSGIKSGQLRSRLQKIFLLFLIVILQGFSKILAQQAMDYAVQANIIYRFTKYIDWPDKSNSGDFIIGIVGDSPLTDELKNFVINKMAGSRKIIVKRFSPIAGTFNCDILFITEDESYSLKKIAARTAGSPILLVAESDGLCLQGACINFIVVSDHLKLEINKNNIEQRKLNIASELLQVCIVVK